MGETNEGGEVTASFGKVVEVKYDDLWS